MGSIQTITVRGEQAYAELGRLRALYSTTGLYPICLGDAIDCSPVLSHLPSEKVTASIIADSFEIDPSRWFSPEGVFERMADVLEEGEWLVSLSEEDQQSNPEEDELSNFMEVLTCEPDTEQQIGLFAVSAPWEVFAHLGWGGWNECPGPAEHCAIHRYWGGSYQSEITVITRDIIRCVVGRPACSQEESMALARDQYVYCRDIVDQHLSSVSVLATVLLGSRHWYFWWD